MNNAPYKKRSIFIFITYILDFKNMNIEIGDTTLSSQRIIGPAFPKKKVRVKEIHDTGDVSKISSVINISRNRSKPARIEDCTTYWFSTDKLKKRFRTIPILGQGALKLNPFGNGGALFSGSFYTPNSLSYERTNYLYQHDIVSTLQEAYPQDDLLPVARHAAAVLILDKVLEIDVAIEEIDTSVDEACGKVMAPDTIPTVNVWI